MIEWITLSSFIFAGFSTNNMKPEKKATCQMKPNINPTNKKKRRIDGTKNE